MNEVLETADGAEVALVLEEERLYASLAPVVGRIGQQLHGQIVQAQKAAHEQHALAILKKSKHFLFTI